MSAISLKSITGITSITTPAGVDNQLTLHNNNTTEAVKLDVAGNVHVNNHLAITGVTTFSGLVNANANVTITNTNPKVSLTDSDANSDYSIHVNAGNFQIKDETNGVNQLRIHSDGTCKITGNLDAESGVDVTGNSTFTGNIDANGDLDVDGHTNLDNVSIAGVTTATGNIIAEANIGIGVASPDTLLEISSTQSGTGNFLKLTSTTNSQSSRPALVFWNNNPNTAQAQISAKGGASYNASKLHFSVANSSRVLQDRACIDEFGTFIIGPGETRRNTKGSNQHQVLLIEGTGNNSTRMSMIRNSNDDNGPEIQLVKTRGTSIGSVTKPNQNDYIGALTFLAGDDSDLYARGAEISVQATGTPANDRVPSDIIFSTTPTSGPTAPQERLRIDSDGDVIIGSGGSWQYKKALNVQGSSGHILSLYNGDTGTYAENTMSGIEFKLRTGNTGNTIAACEIRAFKENGTNGDSARALSFYTGVNGGSPNERVRILSNGRVHIRPTNTFYAMNTQGTNLVIGDGGGGVGLTFLTAGAADNQTISFQCNETLSRAEGEISYGPTATSVTNDRNAMMFRTNSAERLRITSDGNITFGVTSTPTAITSAAIKYISGGRDYWNGTKGDYRALRLRVYDNGGNIDDQYGVGVSSGELEIQSQDDIGFYAGGAGSGTGQRNLRFRLDASVNSLEFESNTNLYLKGTANAPQRHAKINIGRNSAGEDRAIDIWGSWAAGESKSITFNHGTTATQMVGQINCIHHSPGSSMRWGKLYHSGDSSTYTMTLDSTSSTTADLNLQGRFRSSKHPAFSVAASSGQSNIGTSATKITYVVPSTIGRNQSNCYDTTHHRFVAPVDGVYTFYVRHWFVPSHTGTLQLLLYRNGSQIKESRFSVGSANPEYNTVQLTSTIFLSATNYIEVYGITYSGSSTNVFHPSSGSFHTEFSGYLVC